MRSTALLATVGLLLCAGIASAAAGPAPEPRGVRSWVYWLTNIQPEVVASSAYDLAVIDYSSDGEDENAFSPKELALMQRKPDGSRRLVLAYLSIGEAEDYRYYWKRDWERRPPAWLDRENPEWKGDFKVRYWDPDWQRLILGAPDAYLDRIIAAGFDGVYLDIVDAFEYYEETRPAAAEEMIRFVARISTYAKGKRPGFLVLPQNAERLLEYAAYRAVIDGVAKEDLYYGQETDNTPVPAEETRFSQEYLDLALRDGKLVLTVDYPTERGKAADAYRKSKASGYVPTIAVRDLDRFVVDRDLDPALGTEVSAAAGERTPARRYATTTAPRGTFRNNCAVDYYAESYRYAYEDFVDDPPPAGIRTDFVAEQFSEWTATYTLTYGITDRWEGGLAVPVVKGHFEIDPDDQVTGLAATSDETGLGNIRLLLAHATEWNEGDDSLRADIEVGLPTDGRDEPFASAEFSGRVAVTGEHTWGRLGVIGVLAGSATRDKDFGDGEAQGEIQVGCSWQIAKRFYTALLVGREEEANKAELDVEWAISENHVLAVSVGGDLGGEKEAFFAEAGLYF